MEIDMRRIIFFAALAVSVLPVFAAAQSYAGAKALADRDEASVSKAQSGVLLASQGAAIDRIVPLCERAMGPAGMPPFVVVVELDAAGKIVATWREGNSDFAVCFEKQLGTLSLFVPPRAPFYTSFEMSMSAGD
ncbi:MULTISPECIES: hypothetical protein [Rhodanobacter]|nr:MULTISPECIES: hypothetical protein [Rhodanobacter]UJJ52603.1 hypothetical protein LRK52_07925 [Rhodanobacter denitrificans]UJJ58604.1 hypothetical protein LRK55_00265 [Rhodanobacter denitrificans]UJM87861.1 hypothetical protein LRJ86_06020 [Rhodanobacter denitrificans]UJM95357.1 hypothetical protein LRK32_07965 [Rhodanobacter denitrificans]UJM98888.1 hypothetical protein LRK44_07970 [Rhodanobacter denitrificans]